MLKQELRELASVTHAKKYDPTLLNAEFLRYSTLTPTGWALNCQPIAPDNFSNSASRTSCS
jgi:hypothetical protein